MKNNYIKGTRISNRAFRTLVRCFAEDLVVKTTAQFCNLNRNTVQRIYTLLRERIVELTLEELQPFAGELK